MPSIRTDLDVRMARWPGMGRWLGVAVACLLASVAFAQEEAEEPSPPPLIEPRAEPPAVQEAEEAPPPPRLAPRVESGGPTVYHRVVFLDGQVLRGRLISQERHLLVLELFGGGRLSIPMGLVRAVEVERGVLAARDGELWFDDVSRTRYFYGPSSMMLKKGEAYFSQKELLFSAFGYGVTDNFSVLVGSVVPAIFFGLQGVNVVIGLKGGGEVAENVHFAGGTEFVALPFTDDNRPAVAGLVFVSGTYGTSDRHGTLALGLPVAAQLGREVTVGQGILAISASWRLTRNLALVGENWILALDLADGEIGSAHGLGVRIMGERFAANLGGVWATFRGVPASFVPIPWVDFTYHFDLLPQPSGTLEVARSGPGARAPAAAFRIPPRG